MLLDTWVTISIVLGCLLVLSLLWGFSRERHYMRVTNKISRGISSLPRAIQQVERSLDNMSNVLQKRSEDAKEQVHALQQSLNEAKRVTLDVEERLASIIRDTRGSVNSVTTFTGGENTSHFGKGDQR